MNEELRMLYRELGCEDALSKPSRVTRGGDDDSAADRQWMRGLPPMGPDDLGLIEKMLREDSVDGIKLLKNEIAYPLSDDQIKEMISEARRAFDRPLDFVEETRKKKDAGLTSSQRRTRGFIEPKYAVPDDINHYPEIAIKPGDYTFEPVADSVGWIVHTGKYWLRDRLKLDFKKADFNYHDEFAGEFIYTMKNRDGRPVEPGHKVTVALFADFGTGLYHSRYIARKIADLNPDYAFHLGDVYYAGRDFEFEQHFKEPLQTVLQSSRLFTMNANHEMQSGGIPYFNFLHYKRNQREGWQEQEQEGSYFCVRAPHFQIVGIDTAYHENNRYKHEKLYNWLEARLREGKARNRNYINILLSPNEAYELGKPEFTNLQHDLRSLIEDRLIDFWFWGNTHYCALFDKSDQAAYVGACVGHGGHPIYLKDVQKGIADHQQAARKSNGIPEAIWVDDSPRFPQECGIRQEMANHGFCLLQVTNGNVELRFYDWLGDLKYGWQG